MKRRSMIRKITRLLKTWENSQLNETAAREILDLIEKNGMYVRPYFNKKGRPIYDWEK